ncbi:MAG: hypothetical protein II919_00510 [Lachnospiraceae bacterium]|nr:hypothetical protein [Lachnospiraceae bacterium]
MTDENNENGGNAMTQIWNRNQNRKQKALSILLVFAMICEIAIPQCRRNLIEMIKTVEIGADEYTGAEPLGEPTVHGDIPECEFEDLLYHGEGAISKLPSVAEYQEGHEAPKFIPFKELQELCHTAEAFDSSVAETYKNERIAICDAEDLYHYSRIVNDLDGATEAERNYYLSLNLILGNNIDYYEMSKKNKYFLPIGRSGIPFTGTFDGQCFEIRNLYFDTYTPVTMGMFGNLSESAVIGNFGMYHPYMSYPVPSSYPGIIVSQNHGRVHDVYVIVDEYDHPESINRIASSNANCVGGIVSQNYSTGVIENSYFAGRLMSSEPNYQHAICADNQGTITNCYYDSQVFQLSDAGIYDVSIHDVSYDAEQVKQMNNIDLKKLNGMSGVKFKKLRAASHDSSVYESNNNQSNWLYPRLYGYTGAGTQYDPFILNTPADLINFPNSYEYFSQSYYNSLYGYYFKLGNCIDMNEVAKNAYCPQVNFDIITNKIASGTVSLVEYKGDDKTAYPFRGCFSAGIGSGDSECVLKHNKLSGASGELTECHMIYNLTIDTPADSIRLISDEVRGDDCYYAALIGYEYGAIIRDLQIVGGSISTGSHNLMKSDNSYNQFVTNTDGSINDSKRSYYTYIASVIGKAQPYGYSYYQSLDNVHSSASIYMGSGDQFATAMGGLVAYGSLDSVNNCSNSGDLVGGYKDINDYPTIIKETYALGGVLGYSEVKKINNVVNYGNIYSVNIVGDETKEAPNQYSVCAGISAYRMATYESGNISNYGQLFDGPVKMDENGKPIFEEVFDVTDSKGKRIIPEGEKLMKPVTKELDSGKHVLQDKNYVSLIGVARDVVTNSYNNADFYVFQTQYATVSGVGGGVVINQYNSASSYNNLNCNDGNIYVFSGCSGICGISSAIGIAADSVAGYRSGQYPNNNSSFLSCNNGNIYVLGGTLKSGLYISGTGIASNGCYNKGEIYVAPAPKTFSGNESYVIAGSGVIQNTSYYLNSINYRNNNVGHVVVDYNKYHYDPPSNDLRIYGSGVGYYCDNYGILSFYHNEKSTATGVGLSLYGSGYQSNNCTDCKNFADIFVDASCGNKSLKSVFICGTGCTPGIANSINVGDIAFSGATDDLYIMAFGGNNWRDEVYKCINLGNVTVAKGSNIGNAKIVGAFGEMSGSDYFMNGWRKDCYIVPELDTVSNQEIFNTLDENKIYGVFNISGYFGQLIICGGMVQDYYDKSDKYIVNNGQINIQDVYVNGVTNITALAKNGYGTSYFTCLADYSKNFADINISNMVTKGTVYVTAGETGSYNVNYGNINIDHVVRDGEGNSSFYVSGLAAGSLFYSCSYSENRGNITIVDMDSAIFNGKSYHAYYYDHKDASQNYGYSYYVGGTYSNYYLYNGGSQKIGHWANYGNITLKNLYSYSCEVGGISNIFSGPRRDSINHCINYGNIEIEQSNVSYLGGICGRRDIYGPNVLQNCSNFGNIKIVNPTSYGGSGYDTFVGGIIGFNGDRRESRITSCENFGNISYENNNIMTDNTNTRSNRILYCGGIVGYNYDICRYLVNYGDILINSEYRMKIFLGGIAGCNCTAMYNMINYGKIKAPQELPGNTSSDNYKICVGGLIGHVSPSSSSATKMYNGINYGEIEAVANVSKKQYVGALIGANPTDYSSYTYTVNRLVDLTEYRDGQTHFPLMGYYYKYQSKSETNADTGKPYCNYSIYNDVSSNGLGTIKVVTLDKDNGLDQNRTTEGLYYSNFVFRKKLVHEMSEGSDNEDNGLVYQDINNLSPYLQSYMKKRFGNDICGAYVCLADIHEYGYDQRDGSFKDFFRQPDTFLPDGLRTENQFSFGCTDDYYENEQLLGNKIPDDAVYLSEYPGARTMKSDLEYYAKQIEKSSMAEVYTTGIETTYYHENIEAAEAVAAGEEGTDVYQKFIEYYRAIETNPAKNDVYPAADEDLVEKNTAGEIIANDKVLYTDLYYYVPVDVLNPDRAKVDPTDDGFVDMNGKISFDIHNSISAKNQKMLYYNSDIDYDMIRDQDNDNISELWLKSYNVDTKLEDDSLWTEDESEWHIKVPYNKNDLSNLGTVYTKVYGVMVAEDGVHKNIIRVNVMLNEYRPNAKLEYVTVNGVKENNSTNGDYNTQMLTSTCDNSFVDGYYAGSTMEKNYKLMNGEGVYDKGNNGLYQTTGRSLTDRYSDDTAEHDKGDYKVIPYYYLTDDIVSTSGQTVDHTADGFHNIEYYGTNAGNITIGISTENMEYVSSHDSIWAEITYQDRLPNAEGDDYNNWWSDAQRLTANPAIDWNDKGQTAANEKPTQGQNIKKKAYVSSGNISDPLTKKSKGYVNVTFNCNYPKEYSSYYFDGIYYGGLYRVDLYYERTHNGGEGTKKHFATLFFYKQHSPQNNQNYSKSQWYYTSYNNSIVDYSNWDEGSNQYSYSGYLQKNDYRNSEKVKDYSYYTPFKNDYLNNTFMIPYDNSRANGWFSYYSPKAYVGNRILSGGTISPIVYQTNTDSPNTDKVKTITLGDTLDRIDVMAIHDPEGVDTYYPASYHWYSDIVSESTKNTRHCEYELVSNGTYKINQTVKNFQNAPAITIKSAKKIYSEIEEVDGKKTGVIEGSRTGSPTFTCEWVGDNISLFHSNNLPSEISGNSLYEGDGFGKDKVKILFKSPSASSFTDITDEVTDSNGDLIINDLIYNENRYFTTLDVNESNQWTFVLNEFAPVGTYKIVPYMVYHMDLRQTTDLTEGINVYRYNDDPDSEVTMTSADGLDSVKTGTKDVFQWTIAYTPFYIDNVPNDDSYLLEYDLDNDESVPLLEEDEANYKRVGITPSEDRELYIVESSPNQEIIYNGYVNYRRSNVTARIDKFNIYSFVPKTAAESIVRLKLPYRASLTEWTGDGKPVDDEGNIKTSGWTAVSSDQETTNSTRANKEYQLTLNYDIRGIIKYYKVVAEDGVTETLYTVHVLPGNRNKVTSLEVAQNKEELHTDIRDELADTFDSSKEVYQEIIGKYGQFNATIKELKDSELEYYELKWFTGSTATDTEPKIYNLKARVYDISVDVPAGYTYDILLLSNLKDGYQVLKDSNNGFSGKRLVLASPDDQLINVRIVLKRSGGDVWGVNYIWNPDSTEYTEQDGKKYVKTYGGGVFDNYVYDTR